MNIKNPEDETVSKTIGQSKYDKGATAGIEGVLFQINLLAVVLLNAFQNFKRWKLSTENKLYGKFDDVVLELPDGAILLQAKHRKNGTLPSSELFSVNSKHSDFSLGKYFFSFQEIKTQSQVKNVIICTNANVKVNTEMRKFLNREVDSCESILYHQDDCSFYTFNDLILPKLEEHVRSYYSTNLKGKDIDEGVITSENLSDFLKHLQFYCNYPSEEKLNKAIKQLFSRTEYARDLSGETCAKYLHNKVLDWFRQYQGVHLEECHVKAIISEMRSNKYCEILETYKVSFQSANLVFNDTKRILHVTSKDAFLLNILKIHRALQGSNKTSASILYVGPQDSVYLQHIVEAFEIPQYTHLVIICPILKNEGEIKKISRKLREILTRKQYKKVILVANSDNKLASEVSLNNDIYDTTEECVTFKCLSADTQYRLLKDKNIVFQGEDISLEELFSTNALETCEQVLDPTTMEKLIQSEKVRVGSLVQSLDENINYYIDRKFKNNTYRGDDIILEDNICDMNKKLILIADSAGTGKSTVLTNMAVTVKKKFPHLWVIRINLKDYTRILKEFSMKIKRRMSIIDLLESVEATKLTNKLEHTVFWLNKKVLLMLDGVDEISPDYTELILSLLIQCEDTSNFAKIFITTRPHMVPELKRRLYVAPITLLPFTIQNQTDFLTNYWVHSLKVGQEQKEKCEQYAKAMIHKLSSLMEYKYKHNVAAIPLHVRMLAEIFETIEQNQKSVDWKGCKEYLEGEEVEPKIPEKMNIANLYEMFIVKNKDIFVTRGNPTGTTEANQALNKQFNESLSHHRSFALKEILGSAKCKYFAQYQQIDKKNMETNILKIGIVQVLDKDLHFIHRTFAEYFVAESVLMELQKQETNPDKTFLKFFIEDLLAHSEFNVVHIFLDCLLQNMVRPLSSEIFRNRQFFTHRLKLNKKYNSNLIHLLAEESCVAILQFLLKCISFKIVTNKSMQIVHVNYSKFQLKCPNSFCVDTLNFIKYLLDQAGVNIGDLSGTTPLHYAIQHGHLKMVKFLVEHGANINSTDGLGFSVLWSAVRSKNVDAINYLISKGADINESCIADQNILHCAASCRDWSIFKLLVEKGADVNIRDPTGRTILYQAISSYPLDIVKFLIQNRADVNIRDSVEVTPLHLAAFIGQLEIVQLLVISGAEVNVKGMQDCTALHLAVINYRFEVVKFLVEEGGVDINLEDCHGCTALNLAKACNNLHTAEILVENGADINKGNNDCSKKMHSSVCMWTVQSSSHSRPFSFLHNTIITDRGA